MKDLKYDLAMAAATAKTQSELAKRPNLQYAEAVAVYFKAAFEWYGTERGQEFLKTAKDALKN